MGKTLDNIKHLRVLLDCVDTLQTAIDDLHDMVKKQLEEEKKELHEFVTVYKKEL